MKKIISLFVVLMLFVGSVIPANAISTDTVQSECEYPDFYLLSQLGIDNGINSDNNALVTREEFVAMTVRALNPASLLSCDGSFSDVLADSDFAGEIYTAKSMKITNGTSEGVFSPKGNLTKNAALKMILVALGYESIAVTYGGYPYGYVRLESTLHLATGVADDGFITVGDAKFIVTNALKSDIATFSSIVNDDISYTINEGMNLLTKNFEFKKISGVVKKAGYLSFDGTFSTDNSLIINNNEYMSLIDTVPFFGSDVNAWVNSNGKIAAIEKTDNSKEIVINAENIDIFKNHTLSVFEGNKIKNYKTEVSLTFIENGRLIAHRDTDFIFENGTIKLIDTDSNGRYDLAVAEKLEYFVITSVNKTDKVIFDKNTSSLSSVNLDSEDDVRVCKIVGDGGVILDFDAISVGSVVKIAVSDDKKVNVCYTKKGDVKEGILNEKGDGIIVVDDIQYKTNSYYEKEVTNPRLGRKYNFYIAGDGTVTYAESSVNTGVKYGYYLDFGRVENGLYSNAIIKILTDANTVETYDIEEKITLDGTQMSYKDTRIDSKLKRGIDPIYQLVRYSLNSDKKLVMLDTCNPTINTSWELNTDPNPENCLTQYTDPKTTEPKTNFRNGSDFLAPGFSVAQSTIFVAPDGLISDSPAAKYDDKAFEITSTSFFTNNDGAYIAAYDFDEYYHPAAVVVYGDTAGETASLTANAQLVYSVTDAATPDGDTTKLIRTYSKGRYNRYYVAPDKLSEITLPNSGDIVRFALDYNKHITSIAVDVSASFNSGVISTTINFSEAYYGITNYISGKVKSIGNGSMVLRADASPATLLNDSRIAPLTLSSARFAIYDAKNGTVEYADQSSVLSEDMVGLSDASYVVCRMGYYAVTDVIIYKN